jgi:hypothetical protein
MFRRKATAPDGSKWKLGRRWFPHRDLDGSFDTPDLPFPDIGDADDIFGAILLIVFAVIAAVFLALLLFNVVVLAIEISILVFGLLIGLFSRVVLRKPWTVFAKSGPQLVERHAVGWRGSRRLIDELAGEVESGGLQRTLQNR